MKTKVTPPQSNQGFLLSLLVVMSGLLVIFFKSHIKAKHTNWIKIFLFSNSLMINDLALRKYQRKINQITAFFILLGQKFISMFVAKMLLTWTMPNLIDSTLLFLLGLHFILFLLFHSTPM